jgi:hypothetical protein
MSGGLSQPGSSVKAPRERPVRVALTDGSGGGMGIEQDEGRCHSHAKRVTRKIKPQFCIRESCGFRLQSQHMVAESANSGRPASSSRL